MCGATGTLYVYTAGGRAAGARSGVRNKDANLYRGGSDSPWGRGGQDFDWEETPQIWASCTAATPVGGRRIAREEPGAGLGREGVSLAPKRGGGSFDPSPHAGQSGCI